LSLVACLLFLSACNSRKLFSTRYYFENESTVSKLEKSYRHLYAVQPFSVGFTDRSFNTISLEIITDSIKYIYEFPLTDTVRLQDSLVKYRIPDKETLTLINEMRSIKCIWINRLDYYTNNEERSLVFMSIRPVAVHLPFTPEKYYILTFYAQPQYFDSEGRLLANRRLRKLRRVNGEIFRRINDKVCYTISEKFR
jgi:hypothetical protein